MIYLTLNTELENKGVPRHIEASSLEDAIKRLGFVFVKIATDEYPSSDWIGPISQWIFLRKTDLEEAYRITAREMFSAVDSYIYGPLKPSGVFR